MRFKILREVSHTLLSVYTLLDISSRNRLVGIITLSGFLALLESIVIATLYPAITGILPVVLDQGKHQDQVLVGRFFSANTTFPIYFIVCFLLLLAINALLRLLYISRLQEFAADVSTSIAKKAYLGLISQDLMSISNIPTKEVYSLFTLETRYVAEMLRLFLEILSLILTSASILIMAAWIAPVETITSAILLLVPYSAFLLLVKDKLRKNSRAIIMDGENNASIVSDGISSIREVILAGSQDSVASEYESTLRNIRHSEASSAFISIMPRYLVESVAALLSIPFVYFLMNDAATSANVLSRLIVLVYAAQKLLPSLQAMFRSFAGLRTRLPSLKRLLRYATLLGSQHRYEYSRVKSWEFNSLELRNVSFRYEPTSSLTLSNVNLTILKGECHGFIGNSGSGKSTLFDMIMGFIRPSSGFVLLNGYDLNNTPGLVEQWMASISHVPQEVFLYNATVLENIVFKKGQDAFDRDILDKTLKVATLNELLARPDHAEFKRSVKDSSLSGGEKQRVSIARALYRNPQLLCLDEFSSSLEESRAEEVKMNIVNYYPGLTKLLITHRKSDLNICNQVHKLECGRLTVVR